MVRFVLLAWLALSVPISLVLGGICRGLGVEPAGRRQSGRLTLISSRSA